MSDAHSYPPLCIFSFLCEPSRWCTRWRASPALSEWGSREPDRLWESHPNLAQESSAAKIQPLQPQGYSWHSALHGSTVNCEAKEIKCQLAFNNVHFPFWTPQCLNMSYLIGKKSVDVGLFTGRWRVRRVIFASPFGGGAADEAALEKCC